MQTEELLRDQMKKRPPRGAWAIDPATGMMDREANDHLVRQVLGEMGKTQEDFWERRFTRSQWDQAMQRVTGWTIPEIRVWQDEYRWYRRQHPNGPEVYVNWSRLFLDRGLIPVLLRAVIIYAIPIALIIAAGMATQKYWPIF